MKSKKLNEEERRQLLRVITQKQTEGLSKTEEKFKTYWGGEVYKEFFGKDQSRLKDVPKKHLQFLGKFKVTSSETSTVYLKLEESLPFPTEYSEYSTIAILVRKSFKKHNEFVRAFRNLEEKKKKVSTLVREVKGVLSSINTTKQLLDVWVELEDDVVRICNVKNSCLPVAVVDNLKERLKEEV